MIPFTGQGILPRLSVQFLGTTTEITSELEDELRPEYNLQELLKGGVRGKYVARDRAGSNVIVLAPDVAQALPTEEAVNEALPLVMRMAQIPHLSPGGDGQSIQAPAQD